MIILTNTTSLEIKLGSSITTSQLPFYVAYVDSTSTTYTPTQLNGITNNTSVVSLVSSPSSGVSRVVKYISIHNEDTVSSQIILQINDGSNTRKLIDFTLESGERLEYTDTVGFRCLTSDGKIKQGTSGGGMIYPGAGIAISTGTGWDTSVTNNSANWNTAYGWGNHALIGYATATSSTAFTNKTGNISQWTNDSGYITSSALSSYTPTSRTLTINGITYDLSANRSWTIATNTFSTGLTDTAGTITSNLSTGISGGQSVIGGTASGNNLTLSSTSNATKGKLLFGTSVYDEVNNRLGIGTTTPSQKLQVQVNDSGLTFPIFIRNANALGQTGIGFVNEANGDYVKAGIVHQRNGAGYGVGDLKFLVNSDLNTATATMADTKMTIRPSGAVGIGTTTPTALLMLAAGTATANTAPFKFTSGTNLTTAEAGAMEYNNTFHLTNSDATRRHIVTAPNTTKVTAAAPYTNDGYITVNIGGTDFKLMTTA